MVSQKYYIILILILTLTLSSIEVIGNIYSANPQPLGDWWYHYEFAKNYAEGRLALFNQSLDQANAGLPYPPLFHLFLVPSVIFNIGYSFAYFWELFAFSIAVLSLMYAVYKLRNLNTALLAGLLIISSFAFFDRAIAIPESFELIFYPLAYLFYFKKKNLAFAVVSLILIYSHGIPSILLLAPLFLDSIWHNKKTLFAIILFSLPLILISIPYIIPILKLHSGTISNQKTSIQEHPLYSILYLGIPITVFSALIPIYYKNLDRIDKLLILSVALMALMIPVWPERFPGYAAIPLSILIAKQIDLNKHKKMLSFMVWIMSGASVLALVIFIIRNVFM